MAEGGHQPWLTESQRAISLAVLNYSSRRKLSNYLNLESMSVSDVVGDFHGLAELVGFSYIEVRNFELERNPTAAVLDEWTQRQDLKPTIGKLVEYLDLMERVDVITDCLSAIVQDISKHENRAHTWTAPVQDQTVSQSTYPSGYNIQDHNVNESSIMSTDDVEKGSPQYYDAFLCYNPVGKDMQFAKKMIDILESHPHNLHLFVPGRNDLPGSSTHTISATLIEKRCRRMVIIMSPHYLNSAACDFQTKFAFCLAPGSRSKKLVPILIEDCTIPSILRHVTLCDYTKQDLQEWIWNRLACAIKAPLQNLQWEPSSCTIPDITLNITSDYDKISSSASSSSSSSSSSNSGSSSSSSRRGPISLPSPSSRSHGSKPSGPKSSSC